MATKKRSQESGVRSQNNAALRAAVDELGDLEIELGAAYAKLSRKQARAAVLHDQILAAYEKSDASTTYVAQGARHAFKVSECERRTVIHYPTVLKTIGSLKFMALATITLVKLKAAAGAKFAACITSARTGPRTLQAIAEEK